AASLTSEIAAKGRAAAVHLVLSVQRPTVDVLGQLGGFLRANLAGRVLLGRGNPEPVEAMLGHGRGDLVAPLTGPPGRRRASRLRRRACALPGRVARRGRAPARRLGAGRAPKRDYAAAGAALRRPGGVRPSDSPRRLRGRLSTVWRRQRARAVLFRLALNQHE